MKIERIDNKKGMSLRIWLFGEWYYFSEKAGIELRDKLIELLE